MKKFKPFEEIKLNTVNGNVFDLSHDHKTSFNLGQLIPVLSQEAVPGDNFNIRCENLIRFAPMLAPIMHRVQMKVQFFFVPNRLIWDNFEEWIRGDEDIQAPYLYNEAIGKDADPEDYMLRTSFKKGSIYDYLGYPTESYETETHKIGYIKMSPLPFLAYYKIYDDYYRDQNFQEEFITNFKLKEGKNVLFYKDPDDPDPDRPVLQTEWLKNQYPQPANWQRDYFTAALPSQQLGDPVLLPLVQKGAVDVSLKDGWDSATTKPRFQDQTGMVGGGNVLSSATAGGSISAGVASKVAYNPNGTLEVRLDTAAVTLNTLRIANELQKFLERSLHAGNRYHELIYAHFETRTKDSRLGRAEMIGSVTQNVQISDVLTTAETLDSNDQITTPAANYTGKAVTAGSSENISYKVTEHGWIIGIAYIVPETAYGQGIHKSLQRFDRFDYLWPGFANLGEQAIKNIEVAPVLSELTSNEQNAKNNIEANQNEFGYIPMYSEYKVYNNRFTADMYDNLDFWHMGRKFAPVTSHLNTIPLNESFTQMDYKSGYNRIFAIESGEVHHIWAHFYFDIKAYRLLPMYGTPRL